MTRQIVDRVLESSRYRDVDPAFLGRLVDEELAPSRSPDETVKRVKRRLHQAVGAFRGAIPDAGMAAAWSGELTEPGFRAACVRVLRSHASTSERVPVLDDLYPAIWAVTGQPQSVLDLGCGLNPLTLPWMGLAADARVTASDVDLRVLRTVAAFLELVGQPGGVEVLDLVARPPTEVADVGLLFKLVTTLDRQDPAAADRLIAGLRVRHAVVSFTTRSLGGRGRGMERAYRDRLERLLAASSRVVDVTEVSVPNELIAVVTLRG